MNPTHPQYSRLRARATQAANPWAGVCAAVILPGVLNGQQVIAPPPAEFTARPPVDPLAGPAAGEEPGAVTTALGAGEGALQWVVTHLQPRILYRFLYADGIQALPGAQVETFIHEIYPGISLNLGKHVNVTYAPVIRIYSTDQLKNTFDQSVAANWHTVYRDWSFGLGVNYSLSTQPLYETGAQTETESIGVDANAVWAMNEATALELGLMYSLRMVGGDVASQQQLSDYQTYSTMDWLSYSFSSGLNAAIGLGAGYDDVSPGTDMTFEQVRGRINWRVQRRLNLSISGGMEARQFLNSDASPSYAPVYDGTLTYQLFEPTRLFVAGSRTVSPSYFVDQLSESTSVSAGIQQRLIGKLFLSVSAGYQFVSYSTIVQNLSVTREDQSTFANARLSAVLFKRADVALLYQYSDNTSDLSQYQYDSNQVGFEIAYHF